MVLLEFQEDVGGTFGDLFLLDLLFLELVVGLREEDFDLLVLFRERVGPFFGLLVVGFLGLVGLVVGG